MQTVEHQLKVIKISRQVNSQITITKAPQETKLMLRSITCVKTPELNTELHPQTISHCKEIISTIMEVPSLDKPLVTSEMLNIVKLWTKEKEITMSIPTSTIIELAVEESTTNKNIIRHSMKMRVALWTNRIKISKRMKERSCLSMLARKVVNWVNLMLVHKRGKVSRQVQVMERKMKKRELRTLEISWSKLSQFKHHQLCLIENRAIRQFKRKVVK